MHWAMASFCLAFGDSPFVKTRRQREQNMLGFYCNRESEWPGTNLEAKKCFATFMVDVAATKVRSGVI